jgi:hypothetical protein
MDMATLKSMVEDAILVEFQLIAVRFVLTRPMQTMRVRARIVRA